MDMLHWFYIEDTIIVVYDVFLDIVIPIGIPKPLSMHFLKFRLYSF